MTSLINDDLYKLSLPTYLPTFTIHPTFSSLIINLIAHLDSNYSKLLLRSSYEYVVRTFRLRLEQYCSVFVKLDCVICDW